MNPSELILRNGRFYRRTFNEQDLGSQDVLLNSLVEAANIMLPRFGNFGGRPVHLMVSSQRIIALVELEKLPFKAFLLPNVNKPLTGLNVVFSNYRGAVSFEDPWVMQKSYGTMLFALVLTKGAGAQVFSPYCCHLINYYKGEMYAPPYPNVYDNSTICMGHEWSNNRNGSPHRDIMGHLSDAYMSFHATNMNGDLTNDSTELMYVRNSDGWKYHSETEYKNIISARPVSIAYLNGFTL